MSRAIAGARGTVVVVEGDRAPGCSPRRRGVVLVAVAMTAAWIAPAAAAGKGAGRTSKGGATSAGREDARAQAKAAVGRAQIDYKLGKFQDALDGYRRAYELFQAPVLLFNIGQCHRNLGDPEKAIFFFEGYLREETRPEPERRKLADELIAELRPEAQRQRAVAEAAALAAARAAAPPPRPRIRLTATDDSRTTSVTTLSQPPSAAPERRRPVTSRWWFWTAVGGACALAAGAAVYYATGEPRLVAPTGSIGTSNPMPPTAASP